MSMGEDSKALRSTRREPRHQQVIASDPDFDKTYFAVQPDGHNQLLAIQEDYLKVGQSKEHLSITKLARGQVKEHIKHLQTMLKT